MRNEKSKEKNFNKILKKKGVIGTVSKEVFVNTGFLDIYEDALELEMWEKKQALGIDAEIRKGSQEKDREDGEKL